MSTVSRHRFVKNRHLGLPMAGLAAAAAFLPLIAAPTAEAAGVLPAGPSDVRTLSPVRGNYINNTLQGVECQAPNTCTPIKYPSFFTAGGVARLDSVLKGDLDPNTVVFAYSNGAQVATHWMADHADDADAPSANTVKFVLMGNSLRAHGGVDAEFGISQPSQYQVIDIAREYDPVADYPDDHFNLLAIANAMAGSQSIHDYRPVDINDPNNIVWTEGNITYVLVPTENLPLLDPLRRIGLTALADKMNAQLKPKVDAGYNRSYIPASALSSSLASGSAVAAPVTAAAISAPAALVITRAPAADTASRSSVSRHTDSSDQPPADTDTSSPRKRSDLADTVRTMTKAAKQRLKEASTRSQSTRAPKESTTGDAPSTKSSTADHSGGGSGE